MQNSDSIIDVHSIKWQKRYSFKNLKKPSLDCMPKYLDIIYNTIPNAKIISSWKSFYSEEQYYQSSELPKDILIKNVENCNENYYYLKMTDPKKKDQLIERDFFCDTKDDFFELVKKFMSDSGLEFNSKLHFRKLFKTESHGFSSMIKYENSNIRVSCIITDFSYYGTFKTGLILELELVKGRAKELQQLEDQLLNDKFKKNQLTIEERAVKALGIK